MDATMQQILDARERRVSRQQALLAQYGRTLLCFTMNIAGPEKNNARITAGFRLGQDLLLAQLKSSRIPIVHQTSYIEPTGCEGYYIVDGDPLTVKALAVQVEDDAPMGRLFDMDVLTREGKICREELGLPGRTCLLCGNPVHICSSRRAHSLAQLQEKTAALLQQGVWQHNARAIGTLAVRSILYEVCTTPKPGLVDCHNSGSHRDMDIFTFMASSAALAPYFTDCARIGMETAHLPPEAVLPKLRLLGRTAEQTMYRATAGVNTHKGAIFCLGILCAAAGRLSKEALSAEAVCREAANLCAGITGELTQPLPHNLTAGERLYAAHGITGVRGEAEAGFPTLLQTALPKLEAGLARGLSSNDAGCAALLAILSQCNDTNLMIRGGYDAAQQIARQIRDLLAADPFPAAAVLKELDDTFREKNLSPGGSADLLAAAWFLQGIPTLDIY